MLTLHTELEHIRGINRRLLTGLEKLGIRTVRDLVYHLPSRYEDYSPAGHIADLEPNQTATIHGKIVKIAGRRSFRRRMTIIEAVIADRTGSVHAVWFNQPYILQQLPAGTIGNFAGKVTLSNGRLCLSNPAYEPATPDPRHTGGLIPIYPETRGLTSRGIRYLLKPILENLAAVPDAIPNEILMARGLPSLHTALRAVHFPRLLADAMRARRRLAFEDLLMLQLAHFTTKYALMEERARPINWTGAERAECLERLPFALTASQHAALADILRDIAVERPMNRLLQGDVGSGKTVVVAVAALLAAKHGYQTALLAPTEVLARQHYATFIKLFSGTLEAWRASLALMTAAECRHAFGEGLEAAAQKTHLTERIGQGGIHITIGTHALIQKTVSFPRLALIIVDEQHRFGVEQRAALMKRTASDAAPFKKPLLPHFLSMSATPIPRTLSLTVFGDLDISIIDELPAGRQPIVTKIIPPRGRAHAHAFIRQEIGRGRQAFVICPRISDEQSAKSDAPSAWDDVAMVTKEYETLSQTVFPDLRIGMLHGKMKSADKARVMADFAANRINILVATSVIEVGVDVPNATVMCIENADRFGLAQLYQFRGRVGRGAHQSTCLLFTSTASPAARARLQSLMEAKNGFELAEKDLALRGPGEFLGKSQTGMPDLAMKALNNMDLVKAARADAASILDRDPRLAAHPILRERLARFTHALHLE